MFEKIIIFSILCIQLHAKPNIYIGGYQKIDGFERATIWPVDTLGTIYPSVVLGDINKNSSIGCITSIADTLYCLGTEGPDNLKKQVLWILKNNLNDVEKIFLETFEGQVNCFYLTAYGDKLYGCGNIKSGENSVAAFILLDSLGNIIKTTPLEPNNLDSVGVSLSILRDKIYISGNNQNNVGTLWVTDIFGSFIESTQLNSQSDTVYIFSNTALKNNLFSVGYKIQSEGYEGTLWITNVNTLATQEASFAKNGYSLPPKSVILIGGRLYISGVQAGSANTAILWITSSSGTVLKETSLGNPGLNSVASSITAISNQVFCVGSQNQINTTNLATLWITDALGSSPLTIALSTLPSEANFIYTPIKSLILENALQKFSNVHYQK